jgi:hypothetical protein
VDLERPGAELVGWTLADVGGAKHRAPTVGEEGTDIGVPAFGDPSEPTHVPAGVLLGNDAEVAREAAPGAEAAQIPYDTDDRGCGEKSDAGHGEQSLDLGELFGERLELVLDVGAPAF